MICPSVVIICSDSWILCLLIWTTPSLFHSPRHDTRRRSLLMLVLSHSNTHHLNRHMVGCGCHEILIERCITALFLSNSSMHLIQLWFWWLSYSDHSFQLISIRWSVHHSDPPRNHQPCYQKLFILTFDRSQAHLQKPISCFHSSKAHTFIAIDSAPNFLISEIENARCSSKITEVSP